MSEERQPENWELEWDNYFDDLDFAIERLLHLATQAEREGLIKAQLEVTLAAADLQIVANRCKDFVNLRVLEMTTELYKQNPLLKHLMENAKNITDVLHVSPFASPAARDDSSQPD